MAEQTFLEFVESKRKDHTDAEIKQAMRSQGFRNEDYDKPLSQARADAASRVQSWTAAYAADADRAIDKATAPKPPSIEPLYGISTEKNGKPLVSDAAAKYKAREVAAAKKDAEALSVRELARKRMMESAKDFQPVGLPEEGTATDDTLEMIYGGDKNLVVSPVSRAYGALKGAKEALTSPLETLKKGYRDMETDVEMTTATKSVPSRIIGDIAETAMAMPKVVAGLFEPLPKGTDEEKYGAEVGKGFVEGAVGGTAETFRHPWETFKAYPVSTAAQLLPAGQAAKLVTGGAQRALRRAASARFPTVFEKVHTPAVDVPQVDLPLQYASKLPPPPEEFLPVPTVEARVREKAKKLVEPAVQKVQRATVDYRTQKTPLGTAIIEEATQGVRSGRAALEAGIGKKVKEIPASPPQAYVVKETTKGRVLQPAEQPFDPRKEREKILYLNEQINDSTVEYDRLAGEYKNSLQYLEAVSRNIVEATEEGKATALAEKAASEKELARIKLEMAGVEASIRKAQREADTMQRQLLAITPKAERVDAAPIHRELRAATAELIDRHNKQKKEFAQRVKEEQAALQAELQAAKQRKQQEAAAFDEEIVREQQAKMAKAADEASYATPEQPATPVASSAIQRAKAERLAQLDAETVKLLEETAAMAVEDLKSIDQQYAKKQQELAAKHAKEAETLSPIAKEKQVEALRAEYAKKKEVALKEAEEYALLDAMDRQEKLEATIAAKKQEIDDYRRQQSELADQQAATRRGIATTDTEDYIGGLELERGGVEQEAKANKAAMNKATKKLNDLLKEAGVDRTEQISPSNIRGNQVGLSDIAAMTVREGERKAETLATPAETVYRKSVATTNSRAREIADDLVRQAKEVYGSGVLVNDAALRANILHEFTKDKSASLPVLLDEQGNFLAQAQTDFEKNNPGKSFRDKEVFDAEIEQQLRDATLATIANKMLNLEAPLYADEGMRQRSAERAAKRLVEYVKKNGLPDILAASQKTLDSVQKELAKMTDVPDLDKLQAHLRKMSHRKVAPGKESWLTKRDFHVSEGVEEALSSRLPDVGATMAAADWMKQSLTTQNPAVIAGNVASNVSLAIARNGLATTAEGVAKALKKLNTKGDEAVKYWKEAGLLETGVEDPKKEFTYARPEGTSKAAHVAKHALRLGVGPLMEKAYKYGDYVFKAAEATMALDRYERYTKKLKEGEFFDVEVSNNVIARITSDDTAQLLSGNKVLREIPTKEALYRASARRANNLYVDFSTTPGISKALKATSNVPVAGLLSAFSPFTTWALATMDLPGKKGMWYRSKVEDVTGVKNTNSSAVERDRAGANLYTAAQRAAYINGMRNTLKDETSQELREAISFQPTDTKLAIVRGLGDPGYVGVTGVGNWNSAGVTDLGMRILIQGVAKAAVLSGMRENITADTPSARKLVEQVNYLTNSEIEDAVTKALEKRAATNPALAQTVKERKELAESIRNMPKEERNQLVRNAEFARKMAEPGYASMDDVKKFMFLAGTPVSQALDAIEKDKTGAATNTALTMLLGGFGQKAMSLGAEAVRRTGEGGKAAELLSGTRVYADKELNKESFLQLVTRKMLSIAWKKYPVEASKGADMTKFIDVVGDSWKRGIGVDSGNINNLKAQLADYESKKQTAAADRKRAELRAAEKTKNIIDAELARWQKQVHGAVQAVSARKLPKVTDK